MSAKMSAVKVKALETYLRAGLTIEKISNIIKEKEAVITETMKKEGLTIKKAPAKKERIIKVKHYVRGKPKPKCIPQGLEHLEKNQCRWSEDGSDHFCGALVLEGGIWPYCEEHHKRAHGGTVRLNIDLFKGKRYY